MSEATIEQVPPSVETAEPESAPPAQHGEGEAPRRVHCWTRAWRRLSHIGRHHHHKGIQDKEGEGENADEGDRRAAEANDDVLQAGPVEEHEVVGATSPVLEPNEPSAPPVEASGPTDDEASAKILPMAENARPMSLFMQKGLSEEAEATVESEPEEEGAPRGADVAEASEAATEPVSELRKDTVPHVSPIAAVEEVASIGGETPLTEGPVHIPEELEHIPAPEDTEALGVPSPQVAPIITNVEDVTEEGEAVAADTAAGDTTIINKDGDSVKSEVAEPPAVASEEERDKEGQGSDVRDPAQSDVASLKEILEEGPPATEASGMESAAVASSTLNGGEEEQQGGEETPAQTILGESQEPAAIEEEPSSVTLPLVEQQHVSSTKEGEQFVDALEGGVSADDLIGASAEAVEGSPGEEAGGEPTDGPAVILEETEGGTMEEPVLAEEPVVPSLEEEPMKGPSFAQVAADIEEESPAAEATPMTEEAHSSEAAPLVESPNEEAPAGDKDVFPNVPVDAAGEETVEEGEEPRSEPVAVAPSTFDFAHEPEAVEGEAGAEPEAVVEEAEAEPEAVEEEAEAEPEAVVEQAEAEPEAVVEQAEAEPGAVVEEAEAEPEAVEEEAEAEPEAVVEEAEAEPEAVVEQAEAEPEAVEEEAEAEPEAVVEEAEAEPEAVVEEAEAEPEPEAAAEPVADDTTIEAAEDAVQVGEAEGEGEKKKQQPEQDQEKQEAVATAATTSEAIETDNAFIAIEPTETAAPPVAAEEEEKETLQQSNKDRTPSPAVEAKEEQTTREETMSTGEEPATAVAVDEPIPANANDTVYDTMAEELKNDTPMEAPVTDEDAFSETAAATATIPGTAMTEGDSTDVPEMAKVGEAEPETMAEASENVVEPSTEVMEVNEATNDTTEEAPMETESHHEEQTDETSEPAVNEVVAEDGKESQIPKVSTDEVPTEGTTEEGSPVTVLDAAGTTESTEQVPATEEVTVEAPSVPEEVSPEETTPPSSTEEPAQAETTLIEEDGSAVVDESVNADTTDREEIPAMTEETDVAPTTEEGGPDGEGEPTGKDLSADSEKTKEETEKEKRHPSFLRHIFKKSKHTSAE